MTSRSREKGREIMALDKDGNMERGMFCRHCGQKNEKEAAFCINCGKPLAAPVEKRMPPKEEKTAPVAPPTPPVEEKAAPHIEEKVAPTASPIEEKPAPKDEPAPPFENKAEEHAGPDEADAPPQREAEEGGSFESLGKNLGKKVDDFARTGNEKAKEWADNMGSDTYAGYSYLAYLISAVVAFLSPFMPYISVSMYGMTLSFNFVRIPSGITEGATQWGDGILLIAIAIAAMVVWKLKNKTAMLCIGGAATVFSLFEMGRAKQVRDLVSGILGGDLIKMGVGYYFCILASIALLASAVLYFKSTKEHQ